MKKKKFLSFANSILLISWTLIIFISIFGIPKIPLTTQTAILSFSVSFIFGTFFYLLNKQLFPKTWNLFLVVFIFLSTLLITSTSESGSMLTPDRELVTWSLLWIFSGLTTLVASFKFVTRK